MANGHNGHAVLRTLELEPIAAPKPAAAAPIVVELAERVADATMVFVAGIIDWQTHGALAPATRERSGELLARVVELQLAHHGEIDFDAVRSEAVGLLYRRHGDAYRAVCYDKATVDAGFMELTGYVFLVANKVVASELALRAN